ncbi:MAG: GNAT family N-acetyltransferase [Bacteroidota bacterium]
MLYEALFVPPGADPFPRELVDRPDLARYVRDWGQMKGDIALVAEWEGNLTGAIWGRMFPAEKAGYGFVDAATPEISIAIVLDHRGNGIGTKLLLAFEKACLVQGIRQLSLSVDKRNPALRLYQRAGFEVFKEEDWALTMMKKL